MNENSKMREAKDQERRDEMRVTNMNQLYEKIKTRNIRLAHNLK